MSRIPICEDVLVRAVEYCRWSGMRFGQLVVNAIKERLAQHAVLAPDAPPSAVVQAARDRCRNQSDSVALATLFYMENGALEDALTAFIKKHTARHEALNKMAQDAVADGTYFMVPDNFQSGETK